MICNAQTGRTSTFSLQQGERSPTEHLPVSIWRPPPASRHVVHTCSKIQVTFASYLRVFSECAKKERKVSQSILLWGKGVSGLLWESLCFISPSSEEEEERWRSRGPDSVGWTRFIVLPLCLDHSLRVRLLNIHRSGDNPFPLHRENFSWDNFLFCSMSLFKNSVSFFQVQLMVHPWRPGEHGGAVSRCPCSSNRWAVFTETLHPESPSRPHRLQHGL